MYPAPPTRAVASDCLANTPEELTGVLRWRRDGMDVSTNQSVSVGFPHRSASSVIEMAIKFARALSMMSCMHLSGF